MTFTLRAVTTPRWTQRCTVLAGIASRAATSPMVSSAGSRWVSRAVHDDCAATGTLVDAGDRAPLRR